MTASPARWSIRSVAVLAVFTTCVTWPQVVVPQSTAGSPQKFRINTLIERLEQGKTALSPADWTFIDLEHGLYLIDQVAARFAEFDRQRKPNGQLPTAPVIRLPMYGFEGSAWVAKQLLDTGALTICFPQVDSKDQALRAVRSMRYPPQKGSSAPVNPVGLRGWAPGRAIKFWGVTQPEYLERADLWPLNPKGELLAMIMIESPEGVKNINDILDVPGVGAIFIGPSDLGMNLGVGLPKTPLAPEEDAAIHTVLKACLAKKVACGIAATGWATPAYRQKLLDEGFRFML